MNINIEKKVKIQLDNANSIKFQNFFKYYIHEKRISDYGLKTFLGNKINKICRFCNRKSPEVKFKKDAHVIPEFLGNKNVLSYFECDNCNQIFSKYETSFAAFLGAMRTISQMKKKNGKVSKHDEKKTGLEILHDKNRIIINTLHGMGNTKIDLDDKTITIKTIKQSYIPLFVMKALIKIGLCLIKDEEVTNFEFAKTLIQSKILDEKVSDNDMLRILIYFIPGPPFYNKPIVDLYTRINNSLYVPEKMIVLNFGNYQYQYFIPNSNNDRYLQGKKIDVPVFPLIIDNSYFERFYKYQFSNLKMSSNQLMRGEKHNINLHFDSFEEVDLKDFEEN